MNITETNNEFNEDTLDALGLFTMKNTRMGLQKMNENLNRLIRLTLSSTNDDDDTKRVYTVEEIQKILGISRQKAYDLIKEAPFRVVHIGNAIRISRADFDRWLDNLDQK